MQVVSVAKTRKASSRAKGDVGAAGGSASPVGGYMTGPQLEWFRQDLLRRLRECDDHMSVSKNIAAQSESVSRGDEADMADHRIQANQQEIVASRLHDQRREIVAALARIDNAEFGYCEDTGEEIGLNRLQANPVARLTIEAQQHRELKGRFRG